MALAAATDSTAPLLAFYDRVLRAQKAVYESFSEQSPSGTIDGDTAVVAKGGRILVREVAERGPELLAAEAKRLLEAGEVGIERLIAERVQAPSDRQFFAKALLQSYGRWLADAGVPQSAFGYADNRCPRCGGMPQLSILSSPSGSSDGGSRQLLCASCLTLWPFRRVTCPACGEEGESKLGYFCSPAFDHVRVDACDRCHHYLKSIDLTRLGVAVPLVDEVAAAPLDAWARDHGYLKIELNLVGF
jgi:formate dehydrogenase accessory protein FdhE